MDAHDIFKKLSRGAIYTKKKPILKQHTHIASIKKEEKPFNSIASPTLHAKQAEVKKDDDEVNHITLLDDITSDTIGSKAKKRKLVREENVEEKRARIELEKVQEYRNKHKINVDGKEAPKPCETFDEMLIDEDIKANLKASHYTAPTPIQQQVIPAMLQRRQILATAPTGSGKTAAFIVPLIQTLDKPVRKGNVRAIILCPTKELAAQIQRESVRLSEGRNFKIKLINKKAIVQAQRCDILITTPNRLYTLLNDNEHTEKFDLSSVEWLIVDEADKLFEETQRGFKEQILFILNACRHSNRKMAMFSATWTPTVKNWCCRYMRHLLRITIGERNTTTDLIEQKLLFVGSEQGKLIEFRELIRSGLQPPVLVFVQSKERAQELFSELIYDGVNVDAIHADRTLMQRVNTVKSFREGKIWILICTELMARGIDFKGVNLVINYDFPTSAISYVHRVGRAGRAGYPGKAITFFTRDDTVNLRSIAHILKKAGCDVPDYMLKMPKHSSRKRKLMKITVPERESILTIPYEHRRNKPKIVNAKDDKNVKKTTKKKKTKIVDNVKDDKNEKKTVKKKKTKNINVKDNKIVKKKITKKTKKISKKPNKKIK